jgi:hypothetical protein
MVRPLTKSYKVSAQSAPQQFLLGSRELFIAQRARIMKLGELLDLGCQICRRRLLNRSSVLRRGGRILLGLSIGCALLIGLIILLLYRGILRRILLLLVVVYRAGSANHDRRAHGSGA